MPRNFVAFLKKEAGSLYLFQSVRRVYENSSGLVCGLRDWSASPFITQEHLTKPLIESRQAVCIAILFLCGMAVQIGIAALNK